MPHSIIYQGLLGGLLLLTLPAVEAQTLVPLQGQSPEQIQSDIAACQGQAGSSHDNHGGERVRGAAVGAVAGAAAAEVRGNRHEEIYDRLDDDRKEDYRRNRAREGATAGVVVGGARHRQERRENRREDNAASDAYSTCMSARGYSLSP